MWNFIVGSVSVAITLAVVTWFVLTRKHPEFAASHRDEHPDTLSERFYGPNPPGPAGPDAESQRPEDTGNALNPPIPSRNRHHTDSAATGRSRNSDRPIP
ncbi:MAG: hypothetical protein JWM12_734 [Ilumatobacteraceae bacterium]|jgi:hypothetical protein|nr:hypothetical protein [Ilumatobacteraceae bacterium]